jgi:hypothetical protein
MKKCIIYLYRQLSSKPAKYEHNAHHDAIHDQGLRDVRQVSPALHKCNDTSY